MMESGLNGPEPILVTKVRPSRPLQGSFALADDGIRDREAGMMTQVQVALDGGSPFWWTRMMRRGRVARSSR